MPPFLVVKSTEMVRMLLLCTVVARFAAVGYMRIRS